MSDLPPGLVLGPAPQKQGSDLPVGLVSGPAPPSIAERLWNTASGMVQAPTRFAQGLAEGVTGEGIPAGRASQFEGGAARFGGRAIGTGVSSIAESLWNDVVKAPGKMLYGETPLIGDPATGRLRSPEGEASARNMAMTLAGVGGFRPGMAIRPGGATLGMGGAGEGVGPIAGGGRVEPLPAAAPARPVPIIPPGQQPPPLGGQALPPAQPGIPAPPGGGATPAPPRPAIPTIPPGVQPPRPTGGAMPPPEPGIPAPPGGTSQPSALASAIATGDPVAVDQAITRRYRQAILPGQTGVKMSNAGVAQEDQRIMTLVDQIIANRNDMTLTKPDGRAMAEGSIPRTRRQFLEGQGQTMEKMYNEYNDMNKAAGATGVRVPLTEAEAYLRDFANRPEILVSYPSVAKEAIREADEMRRVGGYTPEEAQRALKNYNGDLQSFYLQKGEQSVAKSGMIAPVADIIRENLNNVIEQTAGPGYAAFRQKFGALRSAQRDLANAARKDLGQHPDTFSKFADFMSSESFIRAIVTMTPEKAVHGLTWAGAKRAAQYLNSPNRAVEQLFKRRMRTLEPPTAAPVGAAVFPPVFAGTGLEAGHLLAPPAMSYKLAPPSGGFPQPKHDPDQPLRHPVF